jgi:hypothetical protein
MESGIVFAGGSKSQLKDVLTWHDGQGRRVWLHSRQTSDSARVYISLSVQTFSNKLPKVSEEEKRLRMKLAAMHEYQLGAEISATSMREIATGEIIQTHSRLVMSEMINQSKDRKIQLVSEIQSRTTSAHRLFLLDTAEEMGADGKDAILIAKLYCQQSESGGRNSAKSTAEMLGIETSLVHTALRIARRNKWLTSLGAGKAGGELTELGAKKYIEFKGPERLSQILSAERIYKK